MTLGFQAYDYSKAYGFAILDNKTQPTSLSGGEILWLERLEGHAKGHRSSYLFTTMWCLWGLRFRADCDVLT